MRFWILAATIFAAAVLKVFTTGDGVAVIGVGHPLLPPFDSPTAACLRAMDEPIAVCGFGAMRRWRLNTFEVGAIPRCRWCFDASLALARVGRDAETTERRVAELRRLGPSDGR